MKIKVKNFTSFDFRISDHIEFETTSSPGICWNLQKEIVESNTKTFIGKLSSISGLENGTNLVIWITLNFLGLLSESISLKLRFVGSNLKKDILHSMSCQPYGRLKPEQEWHSGYATVHFCPLASLYFSLEFFYLDLLSWGI